MIDRAQYFNINDFDDVCDKCKWSYEGDFKYSDCEYCNIPKIIQSNNVLLDFVEQHLKDIDIYE